MGARVISIDSNLIAYKRYLQSAIAKLLTHELMLDVHPNRISIKTAVHQARASVTVYLDDLLVIRYSEQ